MCEKGFLSTKFTTQFDHVRKGTVSVSQKLQNVHFSVHPEARQKEEKEDGDSTSGSLDLAEDSRVDVVGVWSEFVNFEAGKKPVSLIW